MNEEAKMQADKHMVGTFDNWWELHKFIATSSRPQYCRYFLEPDFRLVSPLAVRPIMQATVRVDKWLWDKCLFPWVKAELQRMYDGTPHHPGQMSLQLEKEERTA